MEQPRSIGDFPSRGTRRGPALNGLGRLLGSHFLFDDQLACGLTSAAPGGVMRRSVCDRQQKHGDAEASADASLAAAAGPRNEAVAGETARLHRFASGVFVGRERELAELRAGLDDALVGRGRLVLLVGEPGVGKSRTADELATQAAERGAEVLVGRCYEGEGAPAYRPWIQVVRAYMNEREPSVLMAEMGPCATDIAQIVPALRDRLPELHTPPPLEPEQARFRLFDSFTTFLKTAASRRP